MAYERGFLNKRLTIAKRATAAVSTRGTDTGSVKYELLGTYWGNKTWNKGAKAMHEGAMDAYDTVMFRMDYRSTIDRWCLIKCEGKWYQIQSLNGDYHENQLQITATEMANQNVNVIPENVLRDADGAVLMDAAGVYLTADF
jgi:head-tail adaptor